MRREPRICGAEVSILLRYTAEVFRFAYRVPLMRHPPDLDDLLFLLERSAVEIHGDGRPLPPTVGACLAMAAAGRCLPPGCADRLSFVQPREGARK